MAKLTKVRQEFEEAYLGQAVQRDLTIFLNQPITTSVTRAHVKEHLDRVLQDAVALGHATLDVWEPMVIVVHDSWNVGFQLKDDWEPEDDLRTAKKD